jgi:hypothetical protein
MSAQDHLGRQWTQPELSHEIHRGLAPATFQKMMGGTGEPYDPEVGKSRVGVHWTASQGVAKTFAGSNGFWGTGTVIHGSAPMSSVETHTPTLEAGQVDISGTLKEKEVPLKKNAPVTVTGKSTIKERPVKVGEDESPLFRVRKRTYNPPRERNA